MIRVFVLLMTIIGLLASCASPKVANKKAAYPPATFKVSDVVIDGNQLPDATRLFMREMRVAANNTRKAYNSERGDGETYTLELSLQSLAIDRELVPVLPITENRITLMATLRHPQTGVVIRSAPVGHQLVALNPDFTRQQQLMRGVLPKAFNAMYGLSATPSGIAANDIFKAKPKKAPAKKKAKKSAPAKKQSVAPAPEPMVSEKPLINEPQSGEPKVITCAVC